MPQGWENVIERTGFSVLPITLTHLKHLSKLEKIHKDPFDRLLIAQALSENCTLISTDPKMKKYRVALVS